MATTQTGGQAIETMLLEERRYPPPEDFAAQANAQPDIYDRSFDDFWETEGRERVTWFKEFEQLYEWEPPYAKWYLGGKLNVTYNCVDRHVEAGNGDKVAYHWEGEPEDELRTITFADLQRDVVRFANALKKLGVRKGTPVGIYMGMVPELPVAMLACARLGAPHTVVFGGFSAAGAGTWTWGGGATSGGTTWSKARATTPRPARASRWTRRICSTCSTR